MRSTAAWRAGGADVVRGALVLGLVCTLAACGSSGIDASGIAGTAGASGAAGSAGGAGAAGIAGAGGATTDGAAGASLCPATQILGTDAGVSPADGGSCTAVVEQHVDEGAFHEDCTTPLVYDTNPPSSGNHYPIWADYKTYTTPVPWGHLVHSLEHGAIVIVYNCPDGCADEVARAQAFINTLPVDPECSAPDVRRVILAPDPTLDVRWAASAWTWTLRAACFDETSFGAFVTAHYGMGREDLCGELSEPFCCAP